MTPYRYDPRHYSPLNIVIRELAKMSRSGSSGPLRVLDVGCSKGYAAARLKELGDFAVYGIEKDPEDAAEAKKHCEKVAVLDLDGPLPAGGGPFPGLEFDAVLFVDVLEHLKSPQTVLARFKSVLAPGGRIFVSLPNVAHFTMRLALLCGRFDYRPSGILDRTHLRFFTYKTGRRLIEDAGYRVLRTTFGSSRFGAFLKVMPFLGNWLGYNLVYFADKTFQNEQKNY